MIIEWDDDLETGIETVDEDHMVIRSLINDLAHYADTERGSNMVHSTLSILEQRTIDHFEQEEGLMAESGYGGLDEHRLEHQRFLTALSGLITRADEDGPETVIDDLLRFLVAWWERHVDAQDRAFVSAMKRDKS